MPNPKIRINIPKNPAEKIALAQKVNGKHVADGNTSPLKLMQGNSWDTLGPVADECYHVHGQAEEMSRKAEELYRKRDALLLKIDDALKSSRNIFNPRIGSGTMVSWWLKATSRTSTSKITDNTFLANLLFSIRYLKARS